MEIKASNYLIEFFDMQKKFKKMKIDAQSKVDKFFVSCFNRELNKLESKISVNYKHQIILSETEFTKKYKFNLDIELSVHGENDPYLHLCLVEKTGYSPLTPNISIQINRSPDNVVFWCELVQSVIN